MTVVVERPTTDCRAATDPEELAVHLAIRHRVFVEEQGVFQDSDLDEHDHDPATVHVIAWVDGQAVGAVRLYPLAAPGAWLGDRLAVLPEARTAAIGAELVRHAVATAGRLGGDYMLAHIQLPNVRFFSYLGWQAEGEVETYVGLPHQPMRIALTPGS